MLRFRISDIHKDRGRFRYDLDAAKVEILLAETAADLRPAGPLALEIEVYRAHGNLVVTGELMASVIMECSRCLRKFGLPVGGKVEFFVAASGSHGHGAEPVDEQDTGYITAHGDEVELDDYLRDFIVLNIPMRTLCSETCKGLCPSCGADLNRGACTCAPKDR